MTDFPQVPDILSIESGIINYGTEILVWSIKYVGGLPCTSSKFGDSFSHIGTMTSKT